jgi:hypothetical protein
MIDTPCPARASHMIGRARASPQAGLRPHSSGNDDGVSCARRNRLGRNDVIDGTGGERRDEGDRRRGARVERSGKDPEPDPKRQEGGISGRTRAPHGTVVRRTGFAAWRSVHGTRQARHAARTLARLGRGRLCTGETCRRHRERRSLAGQQHRDQSRQPESQKAHGGVVAGTVSRR